MNERRAGRGLGGYARSGPVLSAACLVVWLAMPARVLAFRLPVNFNQSAKVGGSGGRYFTGSPADRYTCKVCHTGGASPDVRVGGLPFDGYTPGQTYQIVIDWDDALPSVAFNLEMTDRTGQGLGTFSVPPVEQLTPADLCGVSSGVVVSSDGGRTMAIMPECGAHQATLRWTAPLTTADPNGAWPQAWFSGSVIATNKDGSVEGDGVLDLFQVLPASGTAAPTANIAGGCTVVRGHSAPAKPSFICLMLLIALCSWLRSRSP